VAEPYTDDLAALGTHTRTGLRSLATTRAGCESHESKPKMRFFKAHPALATLIVVGILGLFAPVAYAIVDRVFLSIDVSKSEHEIEQDVKDQLTAAGRDNATVKATKGDHEYTVEISSDNPEDLGKLSLQIAAGGKTYNVHLDLPPTLTEAQGTAVGMAASTALERPNGETDAQVEQQIKAALATAGLTDYTVGVRELEVSITVRK
jgi:uncharacterized protein with GYD domain